MSDPITFTDDQGQNRTLLSLPSDVVDELADIGYVTNKPFATPDDLEKAGYVPKEQRDLLYGKFCEQRGRAEKAEKAAEAAKREVTERPHASIDDTDLPEILGVERKI
jgi:hypothetical protein